MGHEKNEMMRLEDLRAVAMGVFKRAGAVKECEMDPGVFTNNEDAGANGLAYAIGTNMVKDGEVDCSREEFMAIIQSTLEGAETSCPRCAERRRK